MFCDTFPRTQRERERERGMEENKGGINLRPEK